MAAIIQSDIERSAVLIGPILQGQSRNDLRAGDVVKLSSVDAHTSYAWTLAFAPQDIDSNPSSAILLTPDQQTSEFTVDHEGAYLVRLVVDAGLPTEDTQFIRFRALTIFGDLHLLAAGERRDEVAVIPADIDVEGWANEQNFNLLTLLAFVERQAASGRIFYVDSNRGLNNLNPQNDPTIAEGFADYSSINAAVSAAAGATPLPSAANPYLVVVRPGLYEEDIDFQPHVHVISFANTEDTRNTLVRAVNDSGEAHTAALTAVGDRTLISGLAFENTIAAQTHPLFEKTGAGTLLLKDCTFSQNGTGATQGPAFQLSEGTLIAGDTKFNASAANEEIVCYVQEGINTVSFFDRCEVIGPNAAEINTGVQSGVNATFRRTRFEATRGDVAAVFGIKSSADLLRLHWCEVDITGGATTDQALTLHPAGDIKGSPVAAEVKYTILDGQIYFNNDNVAANNTTLLLGASEYTGISLTGGSPALGTQAATTRADSLFYDGTTVSAPWEQVQEALEQIASVLNNSGATGGGISLDAAYDGLDFNNMTTGSGTGRDIYADQGPVRILADPAPSTPPDVASADGRLQVEGPTEIGGIDAPEISLEPNPYGTGPRIIMGNTVFPDIAAGSNRTAIRSVLMARSTGTPLFHNYNLWIGTQGTGGASHGEVGRTIIQGGDALASTPDAGHVYIQGGHSYGSGDQGDLYLAPGGKTTATVAEGVIWIARSLSNTGATLTAQGVFVGGVDGDITFALAGVGLQTASILAGDSIVNVAAKLEALDGIESVATGGGILAITTSAVGPNADVYFAFDDQSGALNTALGDFTPPAVFTPGAYGDTVSIECDSAGSLTVNGDLNVTGTLTTDWNRTVVNAGPYTVLADDRYIAVKNTSAAPIAIYLPDTVAAGVRDGRPLTIKDEDGNASSFNITIQVGNPQSGTIDGAVSLVLNTDRQSVTLVCNGQEDPDTEWNIA